MAGSIVSNVEDVDALARDAAEWATQNGLLMRLGDGVPEAAVIHAPMSVLPTPFPRRPFAEALDIMPTLNLLVDAVSSDIEFLKSTLETAAEYDDFTKNLLEVCEATRACTVARADKEVTIGIHRSDYMLDDPTGKLLQVELNTIASSFGALGSKVSQMHRYISRYAPQIGLNSDEVPENNALSEVSTDLAGAHDAVGLPVSVILMVVQPEERNLYDQQLITSMMWEAFGIHTIRRTLREVAEQGKLDFEGNLRVGERLVSVVYFRAGYGPKDYPTSREWDARALIESSAAAKCPSVTYHLTGTKKVQQQLAMPGTVERFLSAQDASRVREFFAGLWGLEDISTPETQLVIKDAIEHPELFVLKPQREGGGNNLYGSDAASVLSSGNGLAAYILQQRIRPPVHSTILMRNGEWIKADTLSELGVYGIFVRKGASILINKCGGHLLRTKVSSSDEGGVATGYAVLDSPYLID